jgi:hypothetical protein
MSVRSDIVPSTLTDVSVRSNPPFTPDVDIFAILRSVAGADTLAESSMKALRSWLAGGA